MAKFVSSWATRHSSRAHLQGVSRLASSRVNTSASHKSVATMCWVVWMVNRFVFIVKGDQSFISCLSQVGGTLLHCLSCNDDVYPFFEFIYNISLCAYLITSPFLLYSVPPSACPPFIYTIILEVLYTVCLTPATFLFLYGVVFFWKLYSSSLRLFTTYAIFFYSPLLSPPFHFPVS